MRDYHRRQEPTMSAKERDRWITVLRRRGWSYRRIGKSLGMSPNGVMQALRRLTEPEKYYQKLEEEVGPVGARPEEW